MVGGIGVDRRRWISVGQRARGLLVGWRMRRGSRPQAAGLHVRRKNTSPVSGSDGPIGQPPARRRRQQTSPRWTYDRDRDVKRGRYARPRTGRYPRRTSMACREMVVIGDRTWRVPRQPRHEGLHRYMQQRVALCTAAKRRFRVVLCYADCKCFGTWKCPPRVFWFQLFFFVVFPMNGFESMCCRITNP